MLASGSTARVASACALVLATLSADSLEPPPFALADDVAPRAYAIELTIDPNSDHFSGKARIDIELFKPQQVIWLNATGLEISSAWIEDGKRRQQARVTPIGGDFAALEVASRIASRTATVTLQYRAPLPDRAGIGPYRLKFDGDWYVFTTFTPDGARSAFPCFDQPRFKTPWDFTIHAPRGLKAFANTKAVKQTDEPDGMRRVEFARTVPLPSEIVAFAVGPFDVLDAPSAGRAQIPVRIITPRGHADEGQDAALSSQDIMARLEAYTGIAYPYDKLDHVALPQAPFGAIENPGLITYRMRSLLLPPGKSTAAQQRSVRAVESHEMAHQWFGDFVTQTSWDDVWLSEGFATWLSAKVMDEELPAARRRLAAVMARERIMAADEGPNARPVRSPINSRADFKTVYNQFVYQKGAAILAMLENWIGPEAFRRGLRLYLRDHHFANATTGELAADLRIASNTDPADVMRDFLDQTGFPEIRAETHCEPGTQPRIIFEQTNGKARWKAPVCWKTDSASNCAVVETRRQIELPAGASCPAWVYANANGAGYYRTFLDAQQISALADGALARLNAAERLTLAHDLAALGERPEAITALRKLARDPEPEVAAAASAALDDRAVLKE